jgi:thymidylate synthase (FAD)
MRLIKPSVEIWDQEEGLNGVYKSIERAGRICYKSSDKITEDSAEPFVDRMIKSLHHSMLEQGTVYLTIPREDINYHIYLSKYRDDPYSECRVAQTLEGIPVGSLYITTNYRVIIEHDWTDDLKYLCEPTKFHEQRITVHFTLDRAVSMEVLRHRKFSFAQESTRQIIMAA